MHAWVQLLKDVHFSCEKTFLIDLLPLQQHV